MACYEAKVEQANEHDEKQSNVDSERADDGEFTGI